MATTKYIVNNLTGQTINGGLTINGNLIVTGTSDNTGVYRGLLTQTGEIIGTSLSDFNYGLIIGETYTITNYVSGDDFSNIADVKSGGTINFDYVGAAIGYGAVDGVTGTTSGLGSGATFNVYWCGSTYNIVNVLTSGVDYVVGDTITILGTDVSGSTPENDITITITGLTPTETGCVFIATGQTPTLYDNGTELTSYGALIVDVLENTLGYDLIWSQAPFGGYGYYIALNSSTGPIYNTFQRDKIEIITPLKYSFGIGIGFPPFIVPSITSFDSKDDLIAIDVINVNGGPGDLSNDLLYYTPIEIKIKQDTDTTPIVIYGSVPTFFPFSNTYISLNCNENPIQDIYCDNTSTVNNMTELITLLNNDVNNVYGFIYAEGGPSGIEVTIPTNIKNQFCSNGTLTFNVYGTI